MLDNGCSYDNLDVVINGSGRGGDEMAFEDYMSPAAASRRLGLCKLTIQRFMNRGVLTSIATPLGRIVPRDEVERLAEQRRQEAKKL